MSLSNLPNFSRTPDTVHRALRLLPRDAKSHGLRHTTIIIIVVSASVGGLLLTLLFYRVLSRSLARSRGAPFPPRQPLVHERELQLMAFALHPNGSVPHSLQDDRSSTYLRRGSISSFVPSSQEIHLQPPTPSYATPRMQSSASPTPFPSSNESSPPSSDAHTTPTTAPTSLSPIPRRSFRHSTPRPFSMATIDTVQSTTTIRSRPSIRAAPHAPHSNIQIVLPAPLALSHYERSASAEPPPIRPLAGHNAYADSWRRSLVDSWIMVGQNDVPEPEHVEPRRSHDGTERRSRLKQRGPSPGPISQRSRSNPSPLSRPRLSLGLPQITSPILQSRVCLLSTRHNLDSALAFPPRPQAELIELTFEFC
ncbi:hypothetical protein BC827DRAFT_931226 [Russula dissimulans]|nr:hypothetical protein BC827DRAFT_931226 [Russula dissimulans]